MSYTTGTLARLSKQAPSVTAWVTDSSGSRGEATLKQRGYGVWRLDLLLDQPGTWVVEWFVDGTREVDVLTVQDPSSAERPAPRIAAPAS